MEKSQAEKTSNGTAFLSHINNFAKGRSFMEDKSSQSVMTGPTLIDDTGNSKIIEILSSWGINLYAGVNGGGVIHLAKHLLPFDGLHQANDSVPRLLNIPEYIAGYIPLGHYLASGKIAAGMFTTGGATLLGASGMLDAKLHDIPAVFLIALNATTAHGRGPLQDMTPDGLNAISTVKSILGDSCLLIDDIKRLKSTLIKAQELLRKSKPVALLFYPDILSKDVEDFKIPWESGPKTTSKKDCEAFLRDFSKISNGRRVVIYVGEEAARYDGIKGLISELSELLKAPTVYSMNGVNAVSHKNKYAAGYIYFGFNDYTKQLWESINENDCVIVLGFDPGEYELNLGDVYGNVWHFTNLTEPYGSRDGHFKHRVQGKYYQVRGDISLSLRELLPKLKEKIKDRKSAKLPADLNSRKIEKPDSGHVDLVEFYNKFKNLVHEKTIIINDVCQAYKDFQYITQRPIGGIRAYSAHRGSVMGHSFGMGIGAKVACPNSNVQIFAGDGCFAYFVGGFPYTKDFGLTVWVIDNSNYHIVDKGLDIVMPGVERERHHSQLPNVDFHGVAEKYGWSSYYLKPNLANLNGVMDAIYSGSSTSILIQIPVDGTIVIGQNPRLLNLKKAGGTYL